MLKIYKLVSNRLEFRLLTHVNLNPNDRCVHLCQNQDVFLLTYACGQAEYIRFQIRLGGGSEQVTRFNVWKLNTVQSLGKFDRQRNHQHNAATSVAQDSATPG